MTAPDPQLIAAILKATEQFTGDPLLLADLICRAHEIRGQIARLDKEAQTYRLASERRRAEWTAARSAVQARCPHPVVKQLWNGHSHEGRKCVVCGSEID